MKGKDFDWQTNEFMLYCRTTQLREKSMMAYEQTLKLFERWCMEERDACQCVFCKSYNMFFGDWREDV